MASIIPQEWSSTAGYPTTGTIVLYRGIAWSNNAAITENLSGNTRPDESDQWDFNHLLSPEDLTGVYHAVRIAVNHDGGNEEDPINQQIPSYILRWQSKLDSILRAPLQKYIREVTTDAMGRIDVSALGIIEIIHLRDSTTGSVVGFLTRGKNQLQLLREDQFAEIENEFSGQGDRFWNWVEQKYDSPGYKYDGRYLYVTPSNMYGEGHTFEITFFAKPATLGIYGDRINSMGQPLNADGQTLMQWTTAGNDPNSFVQARVLVRENLYTGKLFIDALISGTISEMALDLNDTEKYELWANKASTEVARCDGLLNDFASSQEQSITQESPYLSGR